MHHYQQLLLKPGLFFFLNSGQPIEITLWHKLQWVLAHENFRSVVSKLYQKLVFTERCFVSLTSTLFEDTIERLRSQNSESVETRRSGDRTRWGEVFRTRPNQPWGATSLLYNGHLQQQGRSFDHPPTTSAAVKGNSRAVPLLHFWDIVACYMANFTLLTVNTELFGNDKRERY